MSYQDFVAEDRRLAILRFLAEDNDYSINDSLMQAALQQVGHSVARSVVLADFSFLKDIGLVNVEVFKDKIHVAKLTDRGLDVAAGRTVVPGVKRPRPE